jgi:hypothetical protein
MWNAYGMVLAFVIAAVALVILMVAWGSTMDPGDPESRRHRRRRHRTI